MAAGIEAEVLNFIAAPEGKDFSALALAVFAYQFERNDPYQRFCAARGTRPATVSRWQDIPAVPTVAFKELDLACGPPQKIFRTSGTTRGRDKRGRHLIPDLRLYHAAALTHFDRCVLPDGGRLRVLALIPSPSVRPDSSLSQMAEWIIAERGAAGSRFFIDHTGIQLEAFATALAQAGAEGSPVCILAITAALVAFFNWCTGQQTAFSLPAGSRVMDTGGDKGQPRPLSRNGFLHACWKYLKVAGYSCVNEYGMTEMASQFYDNVLYNRFHHSTEPRYKIGPAWTRTLVVDPDSLQAVPPGQPGILRHLDLANCGSVMAIQTDDVGHLTRAGFELSGRAPGAEARGCALALDEFLAALDTT